MATVDPRVGFWLLAGLLAAFAAAKAVRFDTLDPDCFWHLRVADQLIHDGVGPLVDRLSFASRGGPWTPYSWAAELAMRAVWRAGGYRAAVGVQAALQAGFVLLLAGTCAEAGRRARGKVAVEASTPGDGPRVVAAAVATAVGAYLSLPYLSFRPVTLALVGMAGCAWLTVRGGRRAVWVVPIAVGLANVHLYALLLPAAAVLWTVGEAVDGRPWRGAAAVSVAVAAASVATPMLPGAVRAALFYGTGDAMVAGPVIAEMRPWGRDPASVVILVGLLVGVARACRRVPTGVILWTAAATLLTLKLGRFGPLLAIAACPPLAVGLSFLSDRAVTRRPVVVALAVVLVACLARVAAAFPPADEPVSAWLDRHGSDAPGYPCGAADFVAAHVRPATGHLVNEFTWGGYLAWRLGDRWQVLLDGRTQVYPPAVWRATYLGGDRRAFLATVRADAAVLPGAGHSLFHADLISLGWRVVYQDAWAEVLVPPDRGH